MRMVRVFSMVMAGALALAAGQAPAAMIAAPITSQIAQLQQWNLITFGDFSAGNEVEGRVFVGGNYNGVTNEQFNFKGSTSSSGVGAITVVGNATGDKVDLTNGDLVVGGSVNLGTIEGHGNNVYAGTTVSAGNNHANTTTTGLAASNANFTSTLNSQKASLISSMTSLSNNLKALASTTNGTLTTDNGHLAYTAGSGLNVLNLTVDQVRNLSYNDINIVSPTGTTTVINVSCAAYGGNCGTIDRNFNDNGSSADIIWNFYDATNLTLGNWQGSVLAVNAAFVKDNQGNLQGTVVANSANISAELHTEPFAGDLSSVVSSAPEPSTWAMLILGFGMIGLAMRRREQRGRGLVLQAA